MPKARPNFFGPTTLVPIGSVLVCISAVIGMTKYMSHIEFKGDATAEKVVALEQEQDGTARAVQSAIDDQRRDIAELKSIEAATRAEVRLLIDHFGIRGKSAERRR